jgi:hypothetical protein
VTVGVLTVRFRLQAKSLKEKRAVVKSTVERVQARFNAAAAEVDDLDTWDLATIAIACVSNEAGHADAMLQAVYAFIEGERPDVEMLNVHTELLRL